LSLFEAAECFIVAVNASEGFRPSAPTGYRVGIKIKGLLKLNQGISILTLFQQ
jgi:hypothetical protein